MVRPLLALLLALPASALQNKRCLTEQTRALLRGSLKIHIKDSQIERLALNNELRDDPRLREELRIYENEHTKNARAVDVAPPALLEDEAAAVELLQRLRAGEDPFSLSDEAVWRIKGLARKLATYDPAERLAEQFGRPEGFEGLVLEGPRGVPVLVAKRGMSTKVQIGKHDLWFQAVDARRQACKVLLRTSLVPSLSKPPRECVEFAGDVAAFFSGWRKGPRAHRAERVEVMFSDPRVVGQKRDAKLRKKTKSGSLWAAPFRVEGAAKEAQEDQGWL